ncbi:VUT family protein [Dactylosporangium sp. NPDC051485]|uniref:VUT family protein n=1 Tax=Dactylosporangium sp. NPDC051485 TaxID=3154846 RepID=UPI0034171D47
MPASNHQPPHPHPAPAPSDRPRRSPITAAVLPVLVFIAAVVAANSLTARYGLIPVGFGLTAAAGTAAAGLTLLARDWVHQTAGRPTVLACIGTGAVFSATPAGPRLAIASAVAFLVAELLDLLVYQRLRDRGMLRAALASNAVSIPVDSLLFLALSGFPVWAALPGQLWVKALTTIVPVAVFAAARALLRHRLRPARS